MSTFNSNILLAILISVLLLGVIIYLHNNNQPVQNSGYIDPTINNVQQDINTKTDNAMDDLASQYKINNNDDDDGSFSPSDPLSENYGIFNNYVKKKQLNLKKMEKPFSKNKNTKNNTFSYKKQKFMTKTPDDVADLFDVDKMLPQEVDHDWFDIEPLQSTQTINNDNLINPKIHIGVNTVGSSLKNPSHDIRGDIPNPKITTSPWNNSSIEPDTNIKGLCGTI